jgi:prepilin-type N-terminal cleavage/methylation domain-containing protein
VAPKSKRSEGFTLVELMLVVAIVGVLSSIGMAQYQHFVAKARQSEAKIGLAAIYASESAFFAENSTYTACLRQIGYVPEGANRYYFIGFSYSAVNSSGSNCGAGGNQPCNFYNFLNGGTACDSHDTYHDGLPSDVAYAATLAASNGAYYDRPLDWHLDATTGASIPTAITSTSFLAGAAGAITSSPASTALLGEPYNINTPRCCDGWSIDQNKRLVNLFPGI